MNEELNEVLKSILDRSRASLFKDEIIHFSRRDLFRAQQFTKKSIKNVRNSLGFSGFALQDLKC